MILRNVNDREVLETTHLADGGGFAQMILHRLRGRGGAGRI